MENVIGNEIENTICIPFSKLKPHKLNEDLSLLLFGLLTSTNEEHEVIKQQIFQEMKEAKFLYDVIKLRSQSFSFTLEDKAVFFLVFICKTPGTAMLYLWYLQWYFIKKKNISNVSLEKMCESFSTGFPSSEDLSAIWDNQKVNKVPDNMVDHLEYGKSILS